MHKRQVANEGIACRSPSEGLLYARNFPMCKPSRQASSSTSASLRSSFDAELAIEEKCYRTLEKYVILASLLKGGLSSSSRISHAKSKLLTSCLERVPTVFSLGSATRRRPIRRRRKRLRGCRTVVTPLAMRIT